MKRKQALFFGLIFFILISYGNSQCVEEIYIKTEFQDLEPIKNAVVTIHKIEYTHGGVQKTLIAQNRTNISGECYFDISNVSRWNHLEIEAKIEVGGKNYSIGSKDHYVSCDRQFFNFSIKNCNVPENLCFPLRFSGTIYNGTEQSKFYANLSINLITTPIGGTKTIFISNKTKYDENGTHFYFPVHSFFINWPTIFIIWIDPIQDYFFRYIDENGTFHKKYEKVFNTSGDIVSEANFIAFKRKDFSAQCNFSDECLSNNCYNKTCVNCTRGDINNDAVIDIFDAIEMLEYMSGNKSNGNIRIECTDANNNNLIDISDAFYVLEAITGYKT